MLEAVFLLGLIFVAFAIGGAILGIISLVRIRNLREKLRNLEDQLGSLRYTLKKKEQPMPPPERQFEAEKPPAAVEVDAPPEVSPDKPPQFIPYKPSCHRLTHSLNVLWNFFYLTHKVNLLYCFPEKGTSYHFETLDLLNPYVVEKSPHLLVA